MCALRRNASCTDTHTYIDIIHQTPSTLEMYVSYVHTHRIRRIQHSCENIIQTFFFPICRSVCESRYIRMKWLWKNMRTEKYIFICTNFPVDFITLTVVLVEYSYWRQRRRWGSGYIESWNDILFLLFSFFFFCESDIIAYWEFIQAFLSRLCVMCALIHGLSFIYENIKYQKLGVRHQI